MNQPEEHPVEVEQCSGCGKTHYLRERDGDLLCPVCYTYLDYHDAISGELLIMLEEWGKKRREGLYKERLWETVHDIITVEDDYKEELKARFKGEEHAAS